MAKRDTGLRFQPAGGSKAVAVPTGKKQRLHIERLANDGRGIAFLDGRRVAVSIASRSEHCIPSLTRALGYRISADASEFAIFVPSWIWPVMFSEGRCHK